MIFHYGPFPEGDEEQNIEVRIDPWDTWGMDHTLAHIIHPMLIQLRDTKQGAPNVEAKDVPAHLRASEDDVLRYKEVGDTDDLFFKRWDWVMDEMIWGFGELLKDWEDAEGRFHTGEVDFISIPIDSDGNEVDEKDATMYRLEKGENDTSHFDKKGYELYTERKQNAFRLFGKYYQSLWD